MNTRTLVSDRAKASDEGGGPHVPNRILEEVQHHICALGDRELEEAVVSKKQSIERANVELALLVNELDERALPDLDHRISTTSWLKQQCNMAPGEASGTVKTARSLRHMPTVTANALSGLIPWRSVRLLSQARDRYPDEFPLHEPLFADTATWLTVKDLRRAVGHWEQQINYPKALTDINRRDRLRGLYLAETYNTMGDIRGTLTPDQYHTIKTALDSLTDPANLDTTDMRSPAQRRADALGDICHFFLTHNRDIPTSGGDKPHITVTIDYQRLLGQLNRLPEIDDNPVTPDTIRRITCDAGIIPVILGSDSEPLNIGRRTRTIPTAIRRAVELRDQGCTWPGCDAPASWCDVHHIIHWTDGGETSLTNSELLCQRHHTDEHNGITRPPEP